MEINGINGSRTTRCLRGLLAISNKLVMLKARLVLSIVIAAVIFLTAGITWKLSLEATDHSFNGMSAQLREDVTVGAVKELKNLLNRMDAAASTLYLSLEGLMPDYSLETLSGPILPPLWSIFNTYKDMTTVMVVVGREPEGTAAYRRNGPEAAALNHSEVVAVPPLKDDTAALLYGYIPDADTGSPLKQGDVAKCCILEKCPSSLQGSEYYIWGPAHSKNQFWVAGRQLPKRVFYWGAGIANGFQPYIFVIAALKDNAGETTAVLALSAVATKLQRIVQSTVLVQEYGGRMFITLGREMNMVTASDGTLYLPVQWLPFPVQARFIPATNSSDHLIHEAAMFMNSTYGDLMHTEPVEAIIHVNGTSRYYINSVPLEHQGLQLVVFLVVPRSEIWGPLGDSRHHGLILVACIGIMAAVVGGLAMCLSTLLLSHVLHDQETELDEVAAANKALTLRLAALTDEDSHLWPHVDMGTPLEKLTAIMKGLKPGDILSVPQLHRMLTLVTADDLHRPHIVAKIASAVDGSSDGGTPRHPVDDETGRWVQILATGRRGVAAVARGSTTYSVSASGARRGAANKPRMQPSLGIVGMPRQAWESASEDETGAGQDPESGGDVGGNQHGRLPSEEASVGESQRGRRANEEALMLTHVTASPEGGSPVMERQLRKSQKPEPKGQPRRKSLRLREPVAQGISYLSVETLRNIAALAIAPAAGEATALSVATQLPAGDPPLSVHNESSDPQGLALAQAYYSTPGGRKAPAPEEQRRQQVALLRSLGGWGFDTLTLAHVSPDSVVQLVGFTLFHKLGLVHEFGINESKLASFLEGIARGMQPQPYHNEAHIADVSASLSSLLMESGIIDYVRPIDRLAVVCAALVHDYRHPGVNNDFLARTRDDLATIYNDESPLENYHLAEAFQLLYSNEHCNFLEVLSEPDFTELRRVVIAVVLATDLRRHFGVLDQFKARASQGSPWDPSKDSDRVLLLQLALKVADIGHAAKPVAQHREWSRCMTEEFFQQGDAEREASLTVSPFMDRYNNNLPRSQLGFFQFLVIPLFEAWVKAFPSSAHLMSNITANAAYWKEVFLGTGNDF